MKRALSALLAFALLALGSANAQSMLTVAYNKTLTLSVPGATSAYAVNPLVAEASVIDGRVQVRGTGAGQTTVVVITPGGQTTYNVVVTAPELAAALGLGDGGASPGEATRNSDGVSQGGTYEGGYNSGAGQVSNAFDFREQQGRSSKRLILVAASYVSSGSSKGTGFPLVSYEVQGPGHDVTFLDQLVSASPLTFQDSLVRGIHVQTGPWVFHAGASSVAGFGQYFVLTNPQWMAGVTRDLRLSRSSDLFANLYDIVNSPAASASLATPSGILGSLQYSYHPQPHFQAQAEVGFSHSVGFSASAAYEDVRQQLDFTFLDKPQGFATLAADNQQGVFNTLDYTRTFNAALTGDLNAQQSNFDQPGFRNESRSAQGTLDYRLGRNVSLGAGATYSQYESGSPTSFNLRTLGIPLSIQYATKNVSAGLQYQPTSDFSGTLANGYGANFGITQGPFQFSTSYNHNVDIPAVSSIFSDVPGLQAALEQAGININDPAQLAALLNNAALLASLGFGNLKLDISPSQNVFGVNASWIPSQRQQVTFNALESDSKLTQGSLTFRLATLAYQRRIDRNNEVAATVSYFNSAENSSVILPGSNGGATSAPSHSTQITYGISLRHRFTSVPAFLFPTRRGNIEGYVFHDAEARGEYAAGDAGLGGIEVTLDGDRTATTDANGHYAFSGVPYGTHQVAAQVKTAKPFFFTTESPASAQIGSRVNFGVSYVQGRIFGLVSNDAGQGIAGVELRIEGTDKHVRTEDDGRFALDGVPQGHYLVTADPDSFPPGYDLSTFTPVSIDVSSNAPWPVTVTARALRSVTGTVTVYDPVKSTLSPAPYMQVSIPQLGVVGKTDANGVYALRNLPAGTYTVQVDGGTPAERRTVIMPADPTTMTGIDFRVTAAQATHSLRLQQQQQQHQHAPIRKHATS